MVPEIPTSPRSPIAEAPVLRSILEAAGRPALALRGREDPRRKQDGSIVTTADLQAQEIIAEALTRSFPGIPIVGEEGGLDEDPGAGARFYVDPIDGTSAYVEGLAYWGPTVGLVDGDEAVLGGLYLPRLDTFYVARRGQGAWVDGLRLLPEPIETLHSRDVLYVPSHFHRVGPFQFKGKTRSLGSTAVHLAQVASGSGVGAIIGRWSPWDVVCGLLLVEEANRVITDLAGRSWGPLSATLVGTDSPDTAPFLVGDPSTVEHLADLLAPLRHSRTSSA